MTNILLFIVGIAGSAFLAVLTVTAMAEAGALGACSEGDCAYASLFMAFPLTWFVLFALFVMGMIVWRRKPRRDRET